jgi:CBS domain-containing protein
MLEGRVRAAVGDLVRPAPSVESWAHLDVAAELLNKFGDTALLVTADDGSRLVALISAADISRAVGDGWSPSEARVDQIVAGPPATVDAALPVREAARTMLSTGVEHLLVRRDDRVLGVVHLVDVFGWLLPLLAVAPRARQPAAVSPIGQAMPDARGLESEEAIGPLIRHLRLAADLTLEGLSEASGISARALSDIERGVARGPQRRTVVAIAGALQLSVSNRAALFRAARAGRQRSRPGVPPLLPVPRRPSAFSCGPLT